MVIFFPYCEQADIAAVGGKGHSLIRMANEGLPVPPGAVLTSGFFATWFAEIMATPAWEALAGATRDQWPLLCAELKARCAHLVLARPQELALEECRHTLSKTCKGPLFAVRSSSPEEDLESAPFAGGYETRLGVRLADLGEVVRHCFASSLDERVFVYKAARGLDVLKPRTAVIVQQQIASDIAGVAFSLNPLTNDYDEAAIDANWGLGESVVSGRASPDNFIVDKVSRKLIDHTLGGKQLSIWLGPDGGTVERQNYRSTERTLTDQQLGELTGMLCRIEAFYDQPTDVEWAYADDRLYVLQARPITTYVPLPPEMMTKPGERRRVYTDTALADGLTINAPISPMGIAWIGDLASDIMTRYIGRLDIETTPDAGVSFAAGGRLYTNLSNAMWLFRPKSLAQRSEGLSTLTQEVITNLDIERYRSATRPPWARFWILRFLPRMMWRMGPFFRNMVWALMAPHRARRAFERKVDDYERLFTQGIDYSLPLDQFRQTYTSLATRHLMDVTLSPLIAFFVAYSWVDSLVRKKSAQTKALSEKLKLGYPDNVVVRMGTALFGLAKPIDRKDFENLSQLAARIERREMPAAFMNAWDAFLSKFGCRGPMEMDVASPRYADNPSLSLRQMSYMTVNDAGFDPEVGQLKRVQERRRAYEELIGQFGWLRRMILRRAYTIVDLFAGTRDTPKYHVVLSNYVLRKRVLIEGRRLTAEGRLDAAEDVFGLTFRDLEMAALDSSLDLRARREERTRFLKKLEAHVTTFPSVIDSRGRILRPPKPNDKPGELSGMAVSPGVVTGPVKLLHNPHEKPIDKGDVLVAYTTDPGWTPLFVNASAIVLEVGGMLQHGAVIAREYGKPCVVGIDRVMTRLRDAQTVEVDGTAGVVRVLNGA